jgi:hypothetical protein
MSPICLISLPRIFSSLGEPLKLVPPPSSSGDPNKRKKEISHLFVLCLMFVLCLHVGCFIFYLKALWKNLGVKEPGKCYHHDTVTTSSLVAQLHNSQLHHDDARTANIRSAPSCYPLGRTVITCG